MELVDGGWTHSSSQNYREMSVIGSNHCVIIQQERISIGFLGPEARIGLFTCLLLYLHTILTATSLINQNVYLDCVTVLHGMTACSAY